MIWSNEPFTFLGINFSVNLEEMEALNFNKRILDIKKLIGSWSRRILTPIGKISVVKTIMIPKLTHLFISLPNPSDKIIDELRKLFFNFIWNNKPDRVARTTFYHNYSQGGLKMIHLRSFIKSMKITWIKRILNDDSTLSEIFCASIQTEKKYL